MTYVGYDENLKNKNYFKVNRMPSCKYSAFVTARRNASAVYAMALCPSVCLSVCPCVGGN